MFPAAFTHGHKAWRYNQTFITSYWQKKPNLKQARSVLPSCPWALLHQPAWMTAHKLNYILVSLQDLSWNPVKFMEDSHLFLFKQTFPDWSTVILFNQLMSPLTSKELDIVGFCSVWPWEQYVRWLLPTCWNGAGNRVAEVPGGRNFCLHRITSAVNHTLGLN